MPEDNVDVMGGEQVAVNEVNQTPDASQDQAQNSEQDSAVPESVPYSRFSEVNNEKNDYKQKYDALNDNINQYLENQNSEDQPTQQQESPEPTTVQEFKDLMIQEIDNRIKPIEKDRIQESRVNHIKNYFAQDKEASNLRPQMDDYYKNLSSHRKEAFDAAVSKGDISVLNEIKSMVSSQHGSNLKNMANDAAVLESNKTFSPSANKVTRDTKLGTSQLVEAGKKDGNFSPFFSQFIQDQGLS